jgi:hypothetical protein
VLEAGQGELTELPVCGEEEVSAPKKSHHRLAVVALIGAATVAGATVWLSAPALSLKRYVPDPVDFELRGGPATSGLVAASTTVGSRSRPKHLYASRVRETGRRFNLVGLRWRGARAATISLRVRAPDGRWSGWAKTSVGDDGPDPGTGEGRPGWTVSDPVWAGQADAVQYRIAAAGSVRDLRLHFVNSTGTATAFDRLKSSVRRAAGSAFATVASLFSARAHAATTQPAIVTRGAWGASKCPPRATPGYGTVKMAFVHHTVSVNTYTAQQSAAIVLGICRYHRNSNGWNDIGYQFLVDRYGQVFEGRAGGMDQAVIGAQAQGYNAVSTGISNIGTFSTQGQTPAGLDALARVLSWKLALHGVPPLGSVVVRSAGGSTNRYPAGRSVRFERISGHRDGDATSCPGDALYAQLPQIRSMVTGDTRSPANLQLKTARPNISYGDKTAVTGMLTTAAGEPLQGQPVSIRSLAGTRVQTLKTIATSFSGSFAANLHLSFNHTLLATFAGNPAVRAAQSTPLTVGVRPRVRATLVPVAGRTLRVGQKVVIRGSVRPHKRTVLLLVDRQPSDESYRRYAKRRVLARGGRMSVAYRFRRRGAYRLRLGVKADIRNLGARSKPILLKVR